MTGRISTGRNGANIWDTLTLSDPVISDHDFTPVHELRKTPTGRKKLIDSGRSLSGYQSKSKIPATERRFVAWDGEGTTDLLGTHHYVLFGNSDGNYITARSLSTRDCLKLLIDNADRDAIHFGFAFAYDVNMIIRDLSPSHLRILKEKNSVIWNRYRLEYVPRKWFVVTDRYENKTTKIWDVWSFFMSSFIEACRQYKVELNDTVIAGKAARSIVTFDKLESDIIPYWKEENQKAVELVEKLREALYAAGLFITNWHGPGAIANYSMRLHNISAAKKEPPKDVIEASQYAYGGGRFELFKVGRANCTVYEYDINSAYPYAIAQLPNFSRGHWRHVTQPNSIRRFGVYRISWRVNPYNPIGNLLRPMPFLHRSARGEISFPCVADTWVWSPELWHTSRFPGLTIHEGWEFIEDDENDRPFAWIQESYAQRKKYKEAGNAAQLALKLQMNSMYGKMAQRVGWNEEKRTAPKWHQLEWAGWVVSLCRANVFRAALRAGAGIVAFETDAVFTTQRLDNVLRLGSELGDWEESVYDDFLYLQSGCRFGLVNSEWKEKYRGFDKGSITVEAAIEKLSLPPTDWRIRGSTTRFIGFAQALHTDFNRWRKFETASERILSIGGEGKRKHVPEHCRACRNGKNGNECFHDAILVRPIGGESAKHPLPWIDADLTEPQTLADASKWETDYAGDAFL